MSNEQSNVPAQNPWGDENTLSIPAALKVLGSTGLEAFAHLPGGPLSTKQSAFGGGRGFTSSYRDAQILFFLWKWKLATTATLHAVAGGDRKPYAMSKNMERLEKHGLVESKFLPLEHVSYWQLTKSGLSLIVQYLGVLTDHGIHSASPYHDLVALSFHLGEWYKYPKAKIEFFTDQELIRRTNEYFPEWILWMEQRRPDGYTRIHGEKRNWVISYEAELSAKSLARYESIIRYYRMNSKVDRVYWLVANNEIRNAIIKAKTKARDTDDNYHLFVDLEEYKKKGWDARLVNHRAETLVTIRESLEQLSGESLANSRGLNEPLGGSSVHLNPVKILGKPRS